MITFISSKVSDHHFTLTSKVKNLSKNVMQTFPFLFIIFIIFILFCLTVQQIKRDVFKDKQEIRLKNCKPIQTLRLSLGHWYTVKTQIRRHRVRSQIMVSTDCLKITQFDESYYVSPLIQKMFVRFDMGGTFYFGINGLGRPKSNSKE